MNLTILTSINFDLDAKFHRIHHLLPYFSKEFSNINYFHIDKKPKSYQRENINFFSFNESKVPLLNQFKILFKLLKLPRQDFFLMEGPYNAPSFLIYKLMSPRSRFIFDDIDYFPDFEKSLFRKLLSYIYEIICLNFSDKIVTIGDFLNELRNKQTNKKIKIIPNGTSVNRLKIKRKNQLVFIGGMEDWFGLTRYLKLVSLLRNKIPSIKLVLILTKIPEKENLLFNEIEKLDIKNNVEVFFNLKEDKIKDKILSESFLGLALYDKRDLIKYAVTLKVSEYSSAGLPIIATNIGETGNFIKKNKNGLTFDDPDDIGNIAMGVVKLSKAKSNWKKMSENSLKSARFLTWKKLSEEFVSFTKN